MPDESLIKGSTVVVVDDTIQNLDLLKAMLDAKGFRVLAFPSGPLALDAMRRETPDLILLDIMMPGMDGFQVCEEIRKDGRLKDVPVLFISALTDTKEKVRGFSVGGQDYITKPFDFREVYARVNTHLELYKTRKQLERYNKELESIVKEKVRELSESQLSTIVALSKLAECRDEDTGAHIERTREFCKILAIKLHEDSSYKAYIDDDFIETIYWAAPLHDIGKVAIPDHILLKPARLTPEEYDIMKTHTTLGAKALEAISQRYSRNLFIIMGIDIARSHHERWDGAGYPNGLKGESIPLSARIMSLADFYDALRSKRPYKDSFSHDMVCRIIGEGKGTHFDPEVVEAFESVAVVFEEIDNKIQD